MSELSQVSSPVMRRIGLQVFNTTVLITALVAALPVLLMGLTMPVGSALLVWVVGAFVVGALVGALLHNTGQNSAGDLLGHYAQMLEHIAEGNLRERLDLSGLDTRGDEAQMLLRLGTAINRTLDKVQGIATEIHQALQRVDEDTHSILDATSGNFDGERAGQRGDRTTATVNEVRATVTETAERAQSVAETAQVSVDISKVGTDAVSETVPGWRLFAAGWKILPITSWCYPSTPSRSARLSLP